MPLPDAPPPKSSRVYQQTTGKTLQSLTVDNLDTISDPVFLDRNSEDELRRINLVGAASDLKSFSGPIPGTLQVVTSTGTSTGNNIAFQPDAGEVWELTAASFGAVGSGSWRGILALKDADGNYVELVDKSTSGTGQSLDYRYSPTYITNDVYLEFTIVTVDTSLSVKCAVVRVR